MASDYVEMLAEQYRAAMSEQVSAEIEMGRLTEAAERGEVVYSEVDEFRNYRYSIETDKALSAAVQLLATLGYPISSES